LIPTSAPEEVVKAPTAFFLYLSYTVPHAGGWGDAPSSPEDGNPVPSDMAYGNQSWPAVEKDGMKHGADLIEHVGYSSVV